jgi:hypothetical protein
VFEYRVTKYDPANRDAQGAYTREEWTAVSDIGHAFAGVVLTEPEYQRVEDAYVVAALAFLRESGVRSLIIAGLENHAESPLPYSDGAVLSLSEAATVIRQVLREKCWCRLEEAGAFLHIGYDYYMYVGVACPCPNAETLARQLGLFVEPFQSPYRN